MAFLGGLHGSWLVLYVTERGPFFQDSCPGIYRLSLKRSFKGFGSVLGFRALEFGGLTDRCSRIREYPGEFEEKSKLIFDCKIPSSREISKIMEKESEGKSKREFYF